MVVAVRRDLSDIKDWETGCDCGGGYGSLEHNTIYVDQNLPLLKQRLVTIHEILDMHLRGRVKHSRIDMMVIDIIDALRQLNFID